MQLDIFPDQTRLQREDPPQNVRRFYRMIVQRDLFGGASLIRESAREDASHPEHDWAKEAGYVDWAPDEIHADADTDQFAKLQRQKMRRTSNWIMEVSCGT